MASTFLKHVLYSDDTSTHIMMRINRQDIRIENLMKVYVA